MFGSKIHMHICFKLHMNNLCHPLNTSEFKPTAEQRSNLSYFLNLFEMCYGFNE